MASESTEDTVAKLEARVAKLERLAPHHRAHINALEALLLQDLPRVGVDDASLRLALSALLPDQPEAPEPDQNSDEITPSPFHALDAEEEMLTAHRPLSQPLLEINGQQHTD